MGFDILSREMFRPGRSIEVPGQLPIKTWLKNWAHPCRWRGYRSASSRAKAVAQYRRRGWNYFVFYKDVQSDFALNVGIADWVPKGRIYLDP